MTKRIKLVGFLGALVFLSTAAFVVYAQGENGPELTLSQAMQVAKDGKTGAAIVALQRIIIDSPDGGNASVHFHLGLLYFKTAQYDNALEEFRVAVIRDREIAMAHYFTAMIYEAKAVQADRPAKKEFQSKALDAWQNYLANAGKMKPKPAGHQGVTVEEGVKQAARHIETLKEALSHE